MRNFLVLAGMTLAVAIAIPVAVPASAQNAPAPAATPVADLPKHACGKPGEFPGNLATDGQKRQYQKDYVAFTDCLKKFALDQQALAEPHLKAANGTIAEYNAAVKAYNDEIEKGNKK